MSIMYAPAHVDFVETSETIRKRVQTQEIYKINDSPIHVFSGGAAISSEDHDKLVKDATQGVFFDFQNCLLDSQPFFLYAVLTLEQFFERLFKTSQEKKKCPISS